MCSVCLLAVSLSDILWLSVQRRVFNEPNVKCKMNILRLSRRFYTSSVTFTVIVGLIVGLMYVSQQQQQRRRSIDLPVRKHCHVTVVTGIDGSVIAADCVVQSPFIQAATQCHCRSVCHFEL